MNKKFRQGNHKNGSGQTELLLRFMLFGEHRGKIFLRRGCNNIGVVRHKRVGHAAPLPADNGDAFFLSEAFQGCICCLQRAGAA
ncbi:hypothetical protein [Akkermansia sp.]|uniref:hypothetical protein n=1 Tax=Akkermansia sp. TaxID=1872421 RepID=UPI0025C6B982|nr:hypothetical protein [Akkermansia sp.]MCC8147696.1 hypothetical protein [Akkermansia sp.]